MIDPQGTMIKKTILFSLCCQFLLPYSSLFSDIILIEEKALTPILTPAFSERQTLKLQLENGLQAYLISDPKVDRSSAALTVDTGSWQDPIDSPGIAHFLEHMIFLGNKKYPKESEFNQFISENGGQFNAFTANDFTGYVFTVDNQALPASLDRFSSFFKEPLFNPSGVDRELQAIDQEYAKNLENDDIRAYFVEKELANPGHPNNAFSMGNRESLRHVSQSILKNWYKEHYSANLMKVEVISNLPLDKIKSLVVENFSGVSNSNLSLSLPEIPLFSQVATGHMVYIDPVKNIRSLHIIWEMPFEFAAMRDIKPEQLICYVLGHEGKKSLVEQLKKEKLVEGLKCANGKIGGHNYIISLDFDLSDAGVKDVDQVILRAFEAIANLKKKGITDHLVEELRTMTKLNYQYQPREDAFEHIIGEAMRLPSEGMESYPEQTMLFQNYDSVATSELLAYLTPENAIYEILAPKSLTGVNFEKKEKWLGVDYKVKSIPQATLDLWRNARPNPAIDLPEVNPYLPVNIDLINKAVIDHADFNFPHPAAILDDEKGKIYFAQDNYYAVPTISWIFEIKSSTIDPSKVESIVMADLYGKYIKETFNSYIYPAAVGGLNFNLETSKNKITISINGYNDKSQSLFKDLIKELKQFRPSEQKFRALKEILLRDYQNQSFDMPVIQAFDVLKSVMHKDYFMGRQLAAAIKKISFDQFQQFSGNLLDKTYVQGIMYGNMNLEDAQSISSYLIATLASQPFPNDEQPKDEIIVLPKDKGPFFIETKSKVQGNATVLAIGLNPYSFKERASQQVLMQAIKEPFFNTLRTKQQTGYIVMSDGEEVEKHLFNIFAVQSNTHEGRDLLARFELFIEEFLQELNNDSVTEENFNNIKSNLLNKLRQPPQSVVDLSISLFKFAFSFDGDFDWMDKRIEGLENLTYEEFLKYTYQELGKENKRRIGIIFSGSTPEDHLKYRRLNGTTQLREVSTYEPAYTVKPG